MSLTRMKSYACKRASDEQTLKPPAVARARCFANAAESVPLLPLAAGRPRASLATEGAWMLIERAAEEHIAHSSQAAAIAVPLLLWALVGFLSTSASLIGFLDNRCQRNPAARQKKSCNPCVASVATRL